MRLNLGAIVKGYAIDKTIDILKGGDSKRVDQRRW
jgi:thiamine biosynthesis lipoprotein ApbE